MWGGCGVCISIFKWIPKTFESALTATTRVLTDCRSAEFVHSITAEDNTRGAKLSIFYICNFTDNAIKWLSAFSLTEVLSNPTIRIDSYIFFLRISYFFYLKK